MGCISVSTGIHTKHSRDLKITALKPMLVQWRSWSREYICSKGRITWIDESQVVGANLMFLFFFSLSAKVELLSWKQERKCVTDKVRSETFTRTNTKEKPSLQIFFQTLVYESLLQKKKNETISTCIYSHYRVFMYPSNQSQVITGSRGAYFRKSQL